MANAQNKKDNLAQQAAMCAKLSMSADGIIRLSEVEVDPEYLDEYMTFATEVGETPLLTEPGVLAMYVCIAGEEQSLQYNHSRNVCPSGSLPQTHSLGPLPEIQAGNTPHGQETPAS